MVICLERDADLHMAKLMPLPLTVSCFSKVQIGFTFLVPVHPGSPGKRAVKRVCACVSTKSLSCTSAIIAEMLLVGDWWRRSMKLAVLLLLAAAETRLLDARPTSRSLVLRRHHGPPRTAAVTDPRRAEAGASSSPGRWTTPCAGSTAAAETPIYPASTDASSSSTSMSEDPDDVTSQHGRRKSLRRLARQMSRLADRVDRLKLRYVSQSVK